MNTADAASPKLYARFLRRFQALVADSVVYSIILVAVVVLYELAGGSGGARIIGITWIASLLLYEPVFVAWRGATLGHLWANIRVVHLRTGGNPGFLRAFGRFLVKGLLGLFAFVFMSLTRRHQAFHDLVFGTTVEIRDPVRASGYDYVTERLPDRERVAAPAWRRVLVILIYSLCCFVLYVFVLAAIESTECLNENRCSPSERTSETVVSLLWLAAQAGCLALGWRGRLLGARSRRAVPPTVVDAGVA